MKKKITQEAIAEALQSGHYTTKMALLVEYYATKSYRKELPFSELTLNKIRNAVIEDIREGYYSKDGELFKAENPTEKEIEKRVLNFYKWEIVVKAAGEYAYNIRTQVESYKKELHILKSRIEEYQTLLSLEALSDALLAQGKTAEEIEASIQNSLSFSDGKSPYTIRVDKNGKAVALLLNHEQAADIEGDIREKAVLLRSYLKSYKGAAEAFINYFTKIEMLDFIQAALRFWEQWSDMVVGQYNMGLSNAYLAGTEPHTESLFPDIIPYYGDIKIPKKEQADYNKIIEESVESIWKRKSF